MSDSRGGWKSPLWMLGKAEAKEIEVCTGDPQETNKQKNLWETVASPSDHCFLPGSINFC